MQWRRPPAVLLVLVLVAVALVGCSTSTPSEADVRPSSTRPSASAEAEPPEAGAPDVVLVWVPGGLPDGLVERLQGLPGVGSASVVLGDTIPLAGVVRGFTVPVEAIAVDCASWSTFEPVHGDAVCGLDDGEALLGATSARLRGAAVGDVLELGSGRRLTVAGVVPDEAVGAAELVVPAAGAAAAGVSVPRYVLLEHDGERSSVEAAIRAAAPGTLLRVRAPDEVDWFRHADAVLPQSAIKATFGEFGSRPASAGRLELDPAWRDTHLVTVELPVVGQVTCHRDVVSALRGALDEIADAGLVDRVDRSASGCWNPRPIAGTDQPSRHAWGVALDIVPAPDDPRVVEVFARWGFTWGGDWLTPDPIHFEYVQPPPRSPSGPAAR